MSVADVIVIGAGPEGLSLGYWLKAAGRSCLILESGSVGESWRRMPAGTYLLSPWWTNVLPGVPVKLAQAWNKVSSEDFARYLEDHARSQQLSVRQRTKVLHVRKASDSDAFEVETDDGRVQRTRLVVCASGYYQNPYIPTLPGGNDGSLFTLHASGYVNPQSLIETSGGGRKILIIGKRITAGQMMQDLHEQGFTVCLSARSPVKMRARWRMNVWKERLYFRIV